MTGLHLYTFNAVEATEAWRQSSWRSSGLTGGRPVQAAPSGRREPRAASQSDAGPARRRAAASPRRLAPEGAGPP